MSNTPTQDEIAGLLEEIASLLDVQDANVFRIRSYRQGARTIRESDADIVRMAQAMSWLRASPASCRSTAWRSWNRPPMMAVWTKSRVLGNGG